MMKIFKSIKWRLQLWYGLILVVVLVGFGVTAYQLERNRQFRHVDDELHRRFSVLATALHHPPHPPFLHEPGVDGRDFDRPPADQPQEEGPPGRGFHHPMPFQLPPEDAHFFDGSDPHDFYYSIHGGRGGDGFIAQSTNVPEPDLIVASGNQDLMAANTISPRLGDTPRQPMIIDNHRVIADKLPSGEMIWVGCSIKPELDELHHTILSYVGFGGLILIIGLAGGWWFVSRALQPVANISATATKISAGDLSQRINMADAESELGQLAAVLNSTFARLETAFAQQKQFASDAAHELRTPVSVILTQAQTALHRERDAASYKQTVEACQRAAQRMKKLIESLLALARFDAGQEVLKRLRFDLAKTAQDCVEMVQPLASEREVKVIVETDSLEITGDPERLSQVVTNLLTNAIQYNHPQGEVRVQLKAQDGLVVLFVSDTGQGIGSADLPHVFGRFYRADKSRTGGSNSGLGLAIAKAIIEAHAGTIEVASEENIGTTFIIRLPIG